MDNLKTREIKGYSENFENFYFTDRAIELHVEEGTGRMEKLILADKKGDIKALDNLRQDFFPLKKIEVNGIAVEFGDNSKIVNRIFGTTIEYRGKITVDSQPKYEFYTVKRTGTFKGLFDGVKVAELKELK